MKCADDAYSFLKVCLLETDSRHFNAQLRGNKQIQKSVCHLSQQLSGHRYVPSLSAPQIFIAFSMKNRVSDKNLRRGKAGYEAKTAPHIEVLVFIINKIDI